MNWFAITLIAVLLLITIDNMWVNYLEYKSKKEKTNHAKQS